MRSNTFSALVAAVAMVPSVFAHYNFESLIVNGQETEAYQYVRQTTNANSPITDVTSNDIICNAGGLDATIMAKTETYTVAAGDEVGFKINSNLGHPGPLAVYMSKASGTAQEYKGDGDWFKVYELTYSALAADGIQWASFVNGGISNFTFTLPTDLPAGEYLMRGEHIGLHGAGDFGGAQFYIGCAQLKVTGSGSGSPSPTVKFPGAYDGNEPGIKIGIYWPVPTSYTAPGPVTWPNSCEDHTANYVGQTSDGDCTGGESSGGGDSSASSAPVSTPTSTVASQPAVTSIASTTPVASVTTTPVASADATSSAAAVVTLSTSTSAAKPTSTASPCLKRRKARRSFKHF
ncbi:unnamed protein product [Clonostachys byssicola]|uniref:lytic cellulose monooxygenase (C4-dehydrogenating) n=1 Tax=Clonostachys byssicola TaxID=160290 RepID=A0A9N9YDR1_9HYPO|nr:unnamed protein product [Clonostachys byssicola]